MGSHPSQRPRGRASTIGAVWVGVRKVHGANSPISAAPASPDSVSSSGPCSWPTRPKGRPGLQPATGAADETGDSGHISQVRGVLGVNRLSHDSHSSRLEAARLPCAALATTSRLSSAITPVAHAATPLTIRLWSYLWSHGKKTGRTADSCAETRVAKPPQAHIPVTMRGLLISLPLCLVLAVALLVAAAVGSSRAAAASPQAQSARAASTPGARWSHGAGV